MKYKIIEDGETVLKNTDEYRTLYGAWQFIPKPFIGLTIDEVLLELDEEDRIIFRRPHEMVLLKDVRIKVTYEVGLGGLSVPKPVRDSLLDLAENSEQLDGLEHNSKHFYADYWLKENILERDCCDLKYEVLEIQSD